MRRTPHPAWPLANLLFLACAPVAIAQSPAHRTVWDGVYTEAQAERGTRAFAQSCAGCHALANEGKAPLVGEVFWKSFSQKGVAELLDFVTTNMPNGSPKSLSDATYADIVALMLKSNGFPPGTSELARNTATDAQILPKDGASELPSNAFARVVGCLGRNGTEWVLTHATQPERAERARPADEDATRALGNRAIALKYVLTRLDAFAGSRVSVNGILIGAGGADGINVTTVNRVATKCP